MANAAIDAYLILRKGKGSPTISGETLDKEFDPKEAVQLKKFRLASQQSFTEDDEEEEPSTETSPEPENDKPYFVFSIEKEIDSATTQLFQAYCDHAKDTTNAKKDGVFSEGLVYLRKASGGKALKYVIFQFKEVYIKTWSLKNTDEDALPEETIEFCFKTCTIQYYPQTADGKAAPVVSGYADFFQSKTSLSKR